jgi:hypothetical protein
MRDLTQWVGGSLHEPVRHQLRSCIATLHTYGCWRGGTTGHAQPESTPKLSKGGIQDVIQSHGVHP